MQNRIDSLNDVEMRFPLAKLFPYIWNTAVVSISKIWASFFDVDTFKINVHPYLSRRSCLELKMHILRRNSEPHLIETHWFLQNATPWTDFSCKLRERVFLTCEMEHLNFFVKLLSERLKCLTILLLRESLAYVQLYVPLPASVLSLRAHSCFADMRHTASKAPCFPLLYVFLDSLSICALEIDQPTREWYGRTL